MTKTNVLEKEQDKKGQTPDMIFINRIKMQADGTAAINYRTSNDKEAREVYFKGREQVTDEFSKKFQDCKRGFVGVLPKLQPDVNKISVEIIKFDYGKTDYLEKALYSVKYAFSGQKNAIVNISTPLLPLYKEEFGDKTFCISGSDIDDLHDVINLAKKYMKGETRILQQDLNLTIVK